MGERDDPQQHDKPGLGNGRLVAHGEGQTGKHAVLKGHGQSAIQLVQQPAGQIHQKSQQPAQAALRPGPGHNALPAQRLQNPALIDLPVAPATQPRHDLVKSAVPVNRAQRQPQMIQITGCRNHTISPHNDCAIVKGRVFLKNINQQLTA